MRFKAEVSNLTTVTGVCESIKQLARKCVVKLTQDKIHFICTGDDYSGVQIWAQFEIFTIFDEDKYQVESNANNEIYLELIVDALYRAFKTAAGATEVIAKLCKRNGEPYLSLAITSSSRSGKALEITQDVPVRVLRQSEMESLKEPQCPDPEVHIILPEAASLSTICDRMGKLSSKITLSANNCGQFNLRAESQNANVQTDWQGLLHPAFEKGDSQDVVIPDDEKAQFYSVTVEHKSLNKLLKSRVIATTTIASICDAYACIFYVYIGSGEARGGVLTWVACLVGAVLTMKGILYQQCLVEIGNETAVYCESASGHTDVAR